MSDSIKRHNRQRSSTSESSRYGISLFRNTKGDSFKYHQHHQSDDQLSESSDSSKETYVNTIDKIRSKFSSTTHSKSKSEVEEAPLLTSSADDTLPKFTSIQEVVTEAKPVPSLNQNSLDTTATRDKEKKRQNRVSFVLSNPQSENSEEPEVKAGLVNRSNNNRHRNLTINTELDTALTTATSFSARSSSAISSAHNSDLEIIELSDIVDRESHSLQSGTSNKFSGTKLSVAFQEYRYLILKEIPPRTKPRFDNMSLSIEAESIQSFIKLAERLRIRSVFFDPELDILNRYCLEFSALAVKTKKTNIFGIDKEDVYTRVYNYMDNRVNSTGTPMDEEPIGPDVPSLLSLLFLNYFRVKSDNSSEIGIRVPILSHTNRLSKERFISITRAIYDRRMFFLRNIDIARHSLNELE